LALFAPEPAPRGALPNGVWGGGSIGGAPRNPLSGAHRWGRSHENVALRGSVELLDVACPLCPRARSASSQNLVVAGVGAGGSTRRRPAGGGAGGERRRGQRPRMQGPAGLRVQGRTNSARSRGRRELAAAAGGISRRRPVGARGGGWRKLATAAGGWR